MGYLLEYDETNPISIETYGKRLIGKTFQDICDEDDMRKAAVVRETENYEVKHENKKRKGGLGELVEERYFHYQSNNDARPDFDKAGVVPLDIDFDLDTYDFSEVEKGYDEISREIQELEQKISWNKKKITVLNDKKKNADSEKAKIIKEEIKDLRNEKKHNQQELDELKNLYKISDEIEEI